MDIFAYGLPERKTEDYCVSILLKMEELAFVCMNGTEYRHRIFSEN